MSVRGGGGCEGQALAGWILVLRLAEAVGGDIILFRPFGPSPLISSYANVCSIFISTLETLFSVVKVY